ncbi:MAG: hypothetical protein F4Y26_11945 [Gammaproteobacteria bacterium]|nr:hypothetical protein [Gammaproteobacteria bacterium]
MQLAKQPAAHDAHDWPLPFASPRLGRVLAVGLAACAASSWGHGGVSADTQEDGRAIEFPDTADHVTLVVDLHTHSVFSDGHVWPYIRVAEAVRDGLDALAVTEHLEYQPHRAHLPHPDRNSAFDEARVAAAATDLIVINGSEITRSAPAGHMNAVFVDDADELLPMENRDEAASFPVEEAVAAANRQGAFVFWNHSWSSPATPNLRTKLTEIQRELIASDQLHGIEVVNGGTYSEESHRIALEHGLVLIGTSDVHNLVDWDYNIAGGGHRPVTLVLADERSPEALRSALFEGRTVVWFKDLLIGEPPHLQALLQAGLTLDDVRWHPSRDVVSVTLANHTESPMRLRHLTTASQSFTGQANLVDIDPHSRTQLTLRPAQAADEVRLEFEVLNALTAPNEHPRIALQADVAPRVQALAEYRHEGDPGFRIAFPEGSQPVAPDAEDQVFSASTPDGVTFRASVAPESDVTLEDTAAAWASGAEATGIGTDFEVTKNQAVTLADGSPAFRAEIRWLYLPAGVRLATQAVFAAHGGQVVSVAAHPLEDSAGVASAARIVESLRFD